MTSGAELLLDSVTKEYGQKRAVDDASLHVQAGELLTLLGPSGCGKTTTLNMIGGFVPLTRGRVWVDKVDISNLPPYNRNLGIVFQDYALFPHMRVEDNIMFPLRMRNIDSATARQRMKDMLKLVQLEGYEQSYPRQLSGGEQQRVAVARALIFEPNVLLMDEPLGALDKQLRDDLQQELRRLHREVGVTILSVTHDQEEALMLSDRIAVMNHGRVEQVGTPDEIYYSPVTPFIADFIGHSNLLNGTVAQDDGHTTTVDISGSIVRTKSIGVRLAAGTDVVLLVRPESVLVSWETDVRETNSQLGTVLSGRVIDLVFLGASYRFRVAVGEGLEILAAVPVSLMQHTGGQRRGLGDLTNGDVLISWDSESCTVFVDGYARGISPDSDESDRLENELQATTQSGVRESFTE